MKNRTVVKTVVGAPAVDGAGVRLTRVLGHDTVVDFDPFLMLDSFDSKEPEDYTKGFPMHPHRGIETITYLVHGEIEHEDSLGNKGTIGSGEAQWMTAGSGILHQEMPKAAEHMLGFQLWLNLPASQKMTTPHYLDVTREKVPSVQLDNGILRVLAGEYAGKKGVETKYIQASVFDISMNPDGEVTIPTKADETVFLFPIEGNAYVSDTRIPEKTAALLSKGDRVTIRATQNNDCRILFFSGRPLHEPVAWGGPIVMNTQKELQQAFAELRNGGFIK